MRGELMTDETTDDIGKNERRTLYEVHNQKTAYPRYDEPKSWTDTDDIKLYSSGTITTNYLPDLVREVFKMNNDVTRQSHYMNLKIQPLMVMLNDLSNDEFKGYLKGNIIKYVLRAERKNGSEDYAKAAFYAKLLDEFVRTGKITLPEAS